MTSTLDQTDAAVRHWTVAPPVLARGVLVVIPGRGEHAGVYERFGRRISADGYEVYAVSAPTDDPQATIDAIEALLAAESAAGPRVLVGSDAGAAFAAARVADGTLSANALILSGLPTGPGNADLGWDDELGARTSCPAHRGKLTEDASFRRGALSDPVPAEWLAGGLAALSLPVLGLHGENDSVSPLADARAVYAKADLAELVSIAGGSHDALNDQTHRTAAATIVLFLERLRLSPELTPIARNEDLSHP